MKASISTEAYIDGVVAYQQIREAHDLTVPQAREHVDTLEVFEELTENVASNPELRMAYIGVIRSRGQNRADAIHSVRDIEKRVAELLWDVEVITDRAYNKTLDALSDDEGVKKRANDFIKLFKPVIPKEELPANRRRKTTRRKLASAEPEEVTDAPTIFAEPEPQIERPAPAPFVPFYERQRQADARPNETADNQAILDWKALKVSGQLLRWVGGRESELTSPEENGFRWVPMAKEIAEILEIPLDNAKTALRNYKASGDLHVVANVDGTRIMSIHAPAAEAAQPISQEQGTEAPEQTEGLDPQELLLVTEIITSLKRAHADQGIKLKSFWVDDKDPSREQLVRSTVRKLESMGMLTMFQPRRQRAAHSRRNTDPFVKAANLQLWRECKDNPEKVLRQIEAQLSRLDDRVTI